MNSIEPDILHNNAYGAGGVLTWLVKGPAQLPTRDNITGLPIVGERGQDMAWTDGGFETFPCPRDGCWPPLHMSDGFAVVHQKWSEAAAWFTFDEASEHTTKASANPINVKDAKTGKMAPKPPQASPKWS